MNYNYLRYFSVLAQVEHYTIAAARLGISQPSLSAAIHQLEAELGDVSLFEKVGRNIRLTEEGRYFREKVDSALTQLNEATLTLRDSKTSAPVLIRMGVASGTLGGTVADQIFRYIHQNERIRFRIIESSSEELLDLVQQEKLDMAIVDTTSRDRSLHFRKLGQRDFCVAMPVDHPLANTGVLLPRHISHEPMVVFNSNLENTFGQWASGESSQSPIICSVNTAQAALELVSAGVGICVIPTQCIQPREDVRFVPLQNWHQALYMCILYDKWLEPPIWGFVDLIVGILRKQEIDKLAQG